ncbi:MAG: YggT family protein [Alphaproteobacteria bacterium]
MIALLLLIVEIIGIYKWVLIASVVLSWLIAFNAVNTRNRFVSICAEFLFRVTEPLLRPIRRFLPNIGGVDLSPLVLFFVLYFIQMLIIDDILPHVASI